MRLIYILTLLIVVKGSYSEKDCQQVLMYFNQGMKTNDVVNMLSENGILLIDKISSMQDNSYIHLGSIAGKLLYKTYLKNFVEECHLFYQQALHIKAEVEEAKKKMIEVEEKERKDAFWIIIGCVVIGWAVVGSCYIIHDQFYKRYTLQRKKLD